MCEDATESRFRVTKADWKETKQLASFSSFPPSVHGVLTVSVGVVQCLPNKVLLYLCDNHRIG